MPTDAIDQPNSYLPHHEIPMTKQTIKAVQLRCNRPIDKSSFKLARTLYECLSQTGHRTEFRTTPSRARQAYFLCLPASVASSPPEKVPPAIQTVKTIAETQLPPTIDVEVVNLELAPLGSAVVSVDRLFDSSQTGYSFGVPDAPMSTLLATLGDQQTPHMLQLVVAPTSSDDSDIAVSLRLAEFAPETRGLTRDRKAAIYEQNKRVSLADHFDGRNLTTTRELLTEFGWTIRLEDRLPGQKQPVLGLENGLERSNRKAEIANQLVRSEAEYNLLLTHAPGAEVRDDYYAIGGDPWLIIESEDLPKFCDLQPIHYGQSPWDNVPGRDRVATAPLGQFPTQQVSAVSNRIKELCDPLKTEADHSLIRKSLRWLLEQGDTIQPAQPSALEVPTFSRTVPTGGTHLLVFISDPKAKRGELVTAMRQATSRSEYLTVIAPTQEDGADAVRTLLEPFAGPLEHRSQATGLYTRDAHLLTQRGIAVRPRDDPPLQWAIEPDAKTPVHGFIDGDVVASGTRAKPLESLATAFDQLAVSKKTGEIIHFDPSGDVVDRYTSKAAARAELQPVYEPALPGTLAAGLESATVFAPRGSQFGEVRVTAPWDQQMATIRESDAADVFFERFTVRASNAHLPMEEALSQFTSWVRHQTDEQSGVSLASTLRSAYNDHPSTTRTLSHRTNTLLGRAWRYKPFSDY